MADSNFDNERLREIVIDLEMSKDRERELRALSDSLYEGVKALTSSNESHVIFKNLITSLESAFKFDFALVATKRLSENLSSEDIYLDCSYATDERFEELSWQAKKTFGRILKGKPVVLASIERIEEWGAISDELKQEIQSSVYLPVIGQRNAAIIMFFSKTSGFYTNHHKSLASKLNDLLNQAILTIEKTEMIKETLSLVNSKNKEIESIVQSIQDALFIIEKNKSIGQIVSPAYRKLILSSNQEEFSTYLDVLNAFVSDQGADQLAIYKASLEACFGEDLFQWELIKDNLPIESCYTDSEVCNRILSWNWAPIVSDAGAIERVLVTVKDITKLRLLEEEALKEKEVLSVISAIIHAGQKNTHDFLNSAEHYLQENMGVVQSQDELGESDIALLFRNMHTIKGNARTYQFVSLCDLSHEIESVYDQIRKGRLEVNKVELLDQLAELENGLAGYRAILEEKLNFTSADKRAPSRDQQLIENISNVVSNSDESKVLSHVKQLLSVYESQDLTCILQRHIDGLAEIAEKVGKPLPKVEIVSQSTRFKNTFANILGDTMAHCFRNSMDHGLESGDERLDKDKPLQGTIVVEILKESGQVYLAFGDDGRGLNINALRAKLDPNNANWDDHQVAQLIFNSGVSTSETVTDISGRGVGMDAVKSYMEKLGGQMFIRFTGKQSNDGFQPFATLIQIPPQYLA